MNVLDAVREERSLRERVNQAVRPYALHYLAQDHVKFVNDAITQLLGGIEPVPLTDYLDVGRASIDPFDAFLRERCATIDLNFNERLVLANETKAWMAQQIKRNTSGPVLSEAALVGQWEEPFDYPRPISPLLLNRSNKRVSPLSDRRLVSKKVSKQFSHSVLKEVTYFPRPLLEEPEPVGYQDVDTILSNRLSFTKAEQANIISFVKSIQTRAHSEPKLPSELTLQPTQDPIESTSLLPPWPITPPLFPRRARAFVNSYTANPSESRESYKGKRKASEETGTSVKRLKLDIPLPGNPFDMEVIKKIAPLVEVEDTKLDVAKENMAIIDGWTAFLPDSTHLLVSPKSAPNEDEDEDDELEFEELPWQPAPLADEHLQGIPEKFEEIQMPRSRRWHASGGNKDSIPADNWNGITTILEIKPVPITPPPSSPYPRHRNLSPSVLGQPPTETGSTLDQEEKVHPEETQAESAWSVDEAVHLITKPVRGMQPEDWILNEKIEDGDMIFVELPRLPPPTDHSHTVPPVPINFKSILAPSRLNKTTSHPPVANPFGLAKIPGLSSLKIELNWRPGFSKPSRPTHVESANASSLGLDNVDGVESLLLRTNALASTTPTYIEKVILAASGDPFYNVKPLKDLSHRLINQAEILVPRATMKQAHSPDLNILLVSHPRGHPHSKDIEPLPASDDLETLAVNNPVYQSIQTPTRTPAQSSPFSVHSQHGQHYRLFSNVSYDEDAEIEASLFPPPAPSLEQMIQNPRHWIPDPSPPAKRLFDRSSNGSTFQPSTSILQNPLVIESEADSTAVDVRSPLQHSPALAPSWVTLDASPGEMNHLLREEPTRLSLSRFMALNQAQARKGFTIRPRSPSPPPETTISQTNRQDESMVPWTQSIPNEVLNSTAIQLSDVHDPPPYLHRYIASIDFAQKHAIVTHLTSPQVGGVELVERTSLASNPELGPDIVVDLHTAIIVMNLARLFGNAEKLLQRLGDLSWRFENVFILFEAFPEVRAYALPREDRPRDEREVTAPEAFSPPVLASLKRLRRDVGIMKGVGDLCGDVRVEYVFARDARECALFVRRIGDVAEGESSNYTDENPWDDREWMMCDEMDEELDLAGFPHMNIFAAISVLSRPVDFLALSAPEREEQFGPLIGHHRVRHINKELDRRQKALAMDDLDADLRADAKDALNFYAMDIDAC